MDRLYNKLGVPIKVYDRRGNPPVAELSYQRTYRSAGLTCSVRRTNSTASYTLFGECLLSAGLTPAKAAKKDVCNAQ